LASIRAAANAGRLGGNFDVVLIAEGGWSFSTTNTLDRCTNGSGVTRDARPADVAELDAVFGFLRFWQVKKVHLLDALECIQSLNLGLNLEIKHDGAAV